MSILETAIKHFENKGEKIIEVPEWGMTFKTKPLNLDEQRRLFEKSKKNEVEALVDLIIMKLLKENGDPAFSLSDKQKLLTQVDPNVIVSISGQITNDGSVLTEKKS